MEALPLGRLMTLTLRLLVDEMHQRLDAAGYGDLRPAHGYVLNAAAAEGGVTASALAGTLGMTKQGAAKVLAELMQAGYIVRVDDDADARARPAKLTSRGRAAVDAAALIQHQLEEDWTTLASPRDLVGLRRTLEAALQAAGGDSQPPPLRPVW